jgi:glycosyltransferase involved in cell wall biosynthesis
MPSRTDSFGIVFLEAWANRLPVVAAAAGGVTEVVEHERTGLLVPFGDVDSLAAALDRLLRNPVESARMGSAGQAMVQHGYTWDDRFVVLDRRMRALVEPGRRFRLPQAG